MRSLHRLRLRAISGRRSEASRSIPSGRHPARLANLPYGRLELLRADPVSAEANGRAVLADPTAGNVVMLDRYRERRAQQDADKRASTHLMPPTPAS